MPAMTDAPKRRRGHLKLVAKDGKIIQVCAHTVLAISPGFQGWLCLDCRKVVPDFRPGDEYKAAICVFRIEDSHAD